MFTSRLAERWNQAHSFSLFLKVIRWSWCVGEITHQIHPSVQTVNSPDRGKAQVLSRQVFKMDYCIKTRGDERNLGKHATTQLNSSRENLTQDLPGISFAPIFQFPTGNDAGSDKEKPQGAVSLVPNERYIRCKVTRSVISKMLAIACSSMDGGLDSMEIVCSMN